MSGLLRICTAGSVDDGKSTLIGRLLYDSQAVYEDQVQVGRGGVQEPDRRADRLLALHRRPARRARAGHHDRRRLPLLRDRAAQVHPRRHARARAVHAQHGDRRVDGRRRHPARRRAARRPRAVAAARAHRATARHLELRPRRQQDGPGRLRPRRVRQRSATTSPRSSPARRRVHADSDERAARRQRHRAERADAVVRRAEPARVSRDRATSTRDTAAGPFRFPVQLVLRPDQDFRGYAGQIASGTVRAGDRVTAWPSGRTSRVDAHRHLGRRSRRWRTRRCR